MDTLITLRAALLLVLLALWLGYGLGRAFKDDATGRQEAYQQGGEDMLRLPSCTAVVVLPTPPFMFPMAIIFGMKK